jgi:enoyl-CoA hydratase/carnithine racemase
MSGFFRLGTVPDIGMMYHLPRLIGMARAKNFLFGGGTMSPQEALELGLVAKVVPDDRRSKPRAGGGRAWRPAPPKSWAWPRR